MNDLSHPPTRDEPMRYLRVRWRQDSTEYPVILYSEIDPEGWEVRKVDEYADGHMELAGRGIEAGSTFLAEEQTPPIEEINADPQFEAVLMSAEDFEGVWNEAQRWFEWP